MSVSAVTGPNSGVFGVRLTSTGAEVTHEPTDEPVAVLVTTTEALVTAFGSDDLAGLKAAGAVITGDPEVIRRLVTSTRIPGSTDQHPNGSPSQQRERIAARGRPKGDRHMSAS